ncbi:hypothetical protein [Streptomyces sp. NPDC029003]|uniref:hypothetical protein n=1 Tax=Streptomyces sp. NPDC029003 TaxID=3155125 RepID=UPI0033D3DAC3
MTAYEDDFPEDRKPDAMAVLSRFAPLAWYRSSLERHPRLGYVQVANLGWRFIEPHDEFMQVFENVTRDAPQHLDWQFKVKRNWLILPARLSEESARCGDNFIAAKVSLMRDQEFCIAASKDMWLILRALDAAAPPTPT